NNVIPQKDTPFDKGKKHDLYEIGVNPNTNFYHNYYFSFLLKEGKLIDYLKLVYSGKKYELTLKLAKSLADHFNIESSFCRNYCTNEVEIISKENNLYSIESHKITEKDLIESDDNPESDFIFTGTIILLIAFGIVGLSFNIEVDYKWIDDYLNYLRNGK
ncbi:MAG: hypothetical protein J6Z11_08910, partial [Candidatus Riflebacteria bacterium]|nr:hypothetical protein [Candidatus Riflebacteria bacterium]